MLTPADLTPYWRAEFEERAAIIEYCANQPRKRAELWAMADIERRILTEKLVAQ